MKRIASFLVIAAATAGITAFLAPANAHANEPASPIYGVTMPPGYCDWGSISVTHEEGNGAGGSETSETANLPTSRRTKPASPATSLLKNATVALLITRLNTFS
jgi:hypothetical protein